MESSTQASPIASLSPELINLIIDRVSIQSPSTLLSLCQVSWHFRDLTSPYLCRTIRLDGRLQRMAASERLLRRILNPGDDLRHYVREIVVLAVGRLSDQFPLLLLEEAVTKIGRLHVFRWEACPEIPRSLHDVLSKYWPDVKLYVTNDSQIGATWTLLGSPILYSLKGRYKRFISAQGIGFEHWQKTYFSACPNLREFECVEESCKRVPPCYRVDVESFNYGLRENNTDWPALETFKVSGSGKWSIDYYDWYMCKIDWTILRSLDVRSARPKLVLALCGKVPALRLLGLDINTYVDWSERFLCFTPWLEELAVCDRRLDAPKHLPLFKASGNTLVSLDYRSYMPWSALELCKLKEICPMLSVLGVCIDFQIPWLEETIVALSAFTEVQHFVLTINIGLSNVEIMDPLISVASAKSLFRDLKSRINGRCFRKLTLHISLCEPIPDTPWSRGKELTLRCRPSERDDRPEEIVVDVEDKESDHWRRVKEDWESGSHEWVSCEALERAVSARALVKKYQEMKKASEEKQ